MILAKQGIDHLIFHRSYCKLFLNPSERLFVKNANGTYFVFLSIMGFRFLERENLSPAWLVNERG